MPDWMKTAAAVQADAARETEALYTAAMNDLVTATAQEKGYNSAESVTTYMASKIPGWAAEAKAFSDWRDDVWVYAVGVMNAVKAGERPLPDLEAFLAGAPAMEWPE